jgi:hypothetical protein
MGQERCCLRRERGTHSTAIEVGEDGFYAPKGAREELVLGRGELERAEAVEDGVEVGEMAEEGGDRQGRCGLGAGIGAAAGHG